MIQPVKIKVRREVAQVGINPAEEFLNLDVEAAVRIELISNEPNPQETISVGKDVPGEAQEASVQPKRPPKSDFRKQFEKIKNMRGLLSANPSH
jgi:hypothetical protein